ncbi:hypothetical protein [Vasconcelosia minhoensis]|nr:hypothetical protein [Romeria gracilis]
MTRILLFGVQGQVGQELIRTLSPLEELMARGELFGVFAKRRRRR